MAGYCRAAAGERVVDPQPDSNQQQPEADLAEYVARRIRITLSRKARRELARRLAHLQQDEPLPLRAFLALLAIIVAALLALAFGAPYLWRMVSG